MIRRTKAGERMSVVDDLAHYRLVPDTPDPVLGVTDLSWVPVGSTADPGPGSERVLIRTRRLDERGRMTTRYSGDFHGPRPSIPAPPVGLVL